MAAGGVLRMHLTVENLFGNVRQVAFGIKSAMCGSCKQKCIEVLRNVWQTWRKSVINVKFVKRFCGHWCQGVFWLPSERQGIPTCSVGESFRLPIDLWVMVRFILSRITSIFLDLKIESFHALSSVRNDFII